jgi:hypothetical protein
MVQTIDFLFTIYIRALIAKVADSTRLHELVPKINTDLTWYHLSKYVSDFYFAVGSMVSAFSAASSTATPRSFKLIGDDVFEMLFLFF